MTTWLYPNDITPSGDRVIASVVYCDDEGRAEQTLLVLHFMAPYFSVVHYDADKCVDTYLGRHSNIVPAVDEYEQNGGDY